MKEGKIILDGTVKEFASLMQDYISETIRKELKNQSPETKNHEYLTKRETASKLKCSISTINTYRKDGILTGYQISGKVVFKSDEIEKVLNKMSSIKYKHRG